MTVEIVDAGPFQVSRAVEVAASAGELFAVVADPRRHHEIDGSGTVEANIRTPERLELGSKFSTKMRMYGVPYRITCTVTALTADQVIEWRHPFGHRWRWEFQALSADTTRVVETFDHRDTKILNRLKYYGATGFTKANVAGIEATLDRLRNNYPA
ncbi:dimethyladenosine transferase [Nocardia sp. SYP-A9097]|uniref:SRPBCC family protein n=1 Tax=Nocardia sp. SYP-A9097 TaxID=2663237 RepID=UPI00129A366D|nr:SRPBCC family protein [Nocardia sp. SYP-A9097]MRH92069.1 dimethyladenosine transferase [Nocardia sp. SYP-A9097]